MGYSRKHSGGYGISVREGGLPSDRLIDLDTLVLFTTLIDEPTYPRRKLIDIAFF